MSIKLPRLNVVLDPNIHKTISQISKKEGLSMSLIARDLIKEALLVHEDAFWAREAEKREKTLSQVQKIRHDDAWT